jgi:hypothetical protein
MMVRYMLEHEKLTVDDLFNCDFDVQLWEERVLKSVPGSIGTAAA